MSTTVPQPSGVPTPLFVRAAVPLRAERPPAAPLPPPHTVLVLGGGGMKGMAHVGVVRVLRQMGIHVDAIVGTSIGALVGARFAMGASVEDVEADALATTRAAVLRRNVRAYLFAGIAQVGLYDGEHYRALIRRLLDGATFATLGIPFRVNALSLMDGQEHWFGWGALRTLTLVDAVYASGALPLIFPPLETATGDVLVDGGIRTMVGVAEAVRWGASRVIAVDVSDLLDNNTSEWRRTGLVGIHGRVVQVMGEPQREAILAARAVPTIHIRPDVGNLASFTFNATRELIDAGEAAAIAALRSPNASAFHAAARPPGPRIRHRRHRKE